MSQLYIRFKIVPQKKKDEHDSPSLLWPECRKGVFNTQLLQNPVIHTYQVKLEKPVGFFETHILELYI